jgi:hypothetical protein
VGSVRAPKREGGRGSSEWSPEGKNERSPKGDGWDWSVPQRWREGEEALSGAPREKTKESQKEMGVIGPCPKMEGGRGSSELPWDPRGKKAEKF